MSVALLFLAGESHESLSDVLTEPAGNPDFAAPQPRPGGIAARALGQADAGYLAV